VLPVAPAGTWFARRRLGPAITLLWEPHADPLVRCNMWHVRGRDRDLLIDSGLGIVSLRAAAADLFEHPLIGVVTHYHFDHTGGMHELTERAVHVSEAPIVASAGGIWATLRWDDLPDLREQMVAAGYDVSAELLVDAVPGPAFDPDAYAVTPWAPTRLLDEGDVVDLGDRAFEVLHLPGHSPGSIGLWETGTGVLFSGDAVYDGVLLDDLDDSDVGAYRRTMERLRQLPVEVVHAGHEPSFGRDRLVELCEAYLRARG
jgi:glyoxylase-like metal-dependent hydrolase (beta-lactamase superfamily II)